MKKYYLEVKGENILNKRILKKIIKKKRYRVYAIDSLESIGPIVNHNGRLYPRLMKMLKQTVHKTKAKYAANKERRKYRKIETSPVFNVTEHCQFEWENIGKEMLKNMAKQLQRPRCNSHFNLSTISQIFEYTERMSPGGKCILRPKDLLN